MENWRKPPGASTRCASARQAAGSGMSIKDMKAVAKEKLPSSKGSAAASAIS